MSRDGELDLVTISEVTGIAYPDLEAFLSGDVFPGEAHVLALRKYLGDGADEFFTHQVPRPDYLTAPWGRVPDQHDLLDYVPADTLRRGDLIAYRRPRRADIEITDRGGILCWARVDKVQVSNPNQGMVGKMMIVTLESSDEPVTMYVQAVKPVRVARPVDSEPDQDIEEVSIEDLLSDDDTEDDDDIDLDSLLSEE